MVRQLGDRAPVCAPRRGRRGVRRPRQGWGDELRRTSCARIRRSCRCTPIRGSTLCLAAALSDDLDRGRFDARLAGTVRRSAGISRYTWSTATASRCSANERSVVLAGGLYERLATLLDGTRTARRGSRPARRTSTTPPRCTTRSRCSPRMVTSSTTPIGPTLASRRVAVMSVDGATGAWTSALATYGFDVGDDGEVVLQLVSDYRAPGTRLSGIDAP